MPADTNNPKQQEQKRPTGIAAAALEGAKQGETSVNPDEVAGGLARPAPGMTKEPEPAHSTSNQYTGVTGGVSEAQEDDEQEWRRAGGGEDAGENPDATDETTER